MPIDPRISLGVQPLQVADPMARYGQMQNILAAQSQQQMSQMQLENMQRDRDALTKMQEEITKNGGPSDLTAASTQMIKSGIPHYMDLGFKIQEKLQNQKNFESLLKGGAAPTTAAPSVAPAPGALGSGTFDPTASPAPVANQLAPAATAPVAAPVNQLSPDVANLRRQIDAAYSLGTPQALAWAQAREKELGELTKPQVVAEGSSVYIPGRGFVATATQKTPAPPAMVAEYEYAKTPAGGGFKGSYQQFVTARAAAGRAPAQPVAPTITQIVDPTNSNQMITIDAKRYQGGGVGSPGVIGVGGKEPGAALRVNKVEQGKTQLADDLENLRASFETLDKLRAVPSTERGPLSNVASGIASTAIGQRTGQFFATEAQVERDVINSARSRLVNSIKNATGMSAQQLNSNVELQTMLKSISDPGQSYQSAIRIIQDIEDAYVTGSGMLPKKDKPGGAPAATQGTGGFKYLGKESK
jgi:hypothetical protein